MTVEEFLQQLRREVEVSLRQSPRWRSGFPLLDGERWRNTNSHMSRRDDEQMEQRPGSQSD